MWKIQVLLVLQNLYKTFFFFNIRIPIEGLPMYSNFSTGQEDRHNKGFHRSSIVFTSRGPRTGWFPNVCHRPHWLALGNKKLPEPERATRFPVSVYLKESLKMSKIPTICADIGFDIWSLLTLWKGNMSAGFRLPINGQEQSIPSIIDAFVKKINGNLFSIITSNIQAVCTEVSPCR